MHNPELPPELFRGDRFFATDTLVSLQTLPLEAAGVHPLCLALPLAHPSALCFGGPDLADLYVTSIADSGRLSASGPLDGAILRISHLGYRGLPKARAAIAPV